MNGIDRRQFLVSAGAAALQAALPPPPQAAPRKIKGVIWLWMGGGMSQIDTFDPKPGTRHAGPLRAIDTTVPAVQFSELLPRCAAQMRHLSVLRTMATQEGDHARGTYLLHTGRRCDGAYEVPSIGTILSHELGRPGLPLPPHIVIDAPVPSALSPFGEEVRPFRMGSAWNPIPNVRRCVDSRRDQERSDLLREQNREWGASRLQTETDRIQRAGTQADDLMNTPLLQVFNWMEEPPELRAEYGDRFGTGCLVARRLVLAGCPFVEVGLGGWNIHRDHFPMIRFLASSLDAGLSSLVKDLASRGALNEVLVVCATEVGRTPAISGGGRDTHADGFSIVLAGGGLKGGVVHGSTGPDGADCKDPVSAADLFATIYQACGVDASKTYDAGGRTFRYVEGGRPLADLF